MKAKDFLNQLTKLDKLINNKIIEREQWKSVALGVTASGESVKIKGEIHGVEKVQSSGGGQKMADAVARYVDIEAEIVRDIDALIDVRRDVISVIEQLNPAEYDFLHKVYVQHIPLYEVGYQLGKSYSWTTTMHRNALIEVQKILDERERKEK